jgi:hypothetical protein
MIQFYYTSWHSYEYHLAYLLMGRVLTAYMLIFIIKKAPLSKRLSK